VSYITTADLCRRAGRESAAASGGLREAQRRYRLFHCFAPANVIRAPCSRLIPEVLVHLGYLRGLIYSSDKGSATQPKSYIHFMETPARLACNPEGTQLYIIGGRYRVTPRGIEG
jgi:hypothetical protein